MMQVCSYFCEKGNRVFKVFLVGIVVFNKYMQFLGESVGIIECLGKDVLQEGKYYEEKTMFRVCYLLQGYTLRSALLGVLLW